MIKINRLEITLKEIKNYFVRLFNAKKARRQSILASKKATPEKELWELSNDKTDWKA